MPTFGPTLRGPQDLVEWLQRRGPALDGRVLGILLDACRRPVAVWTPSSPEDRPAIPSEVVATVVVFDRTGDGITPRPEDIEIWRIWAGQAPDDLPIIDVLLVDGDEWETLGIFDGVLR